MALTLFFTWRAAVSHIRKDGLLPFVQQGDPCDVYPKGMMVIPGSLYSVNQNTLIVDAKTELSESIQGEWVPAQVRVLGWYQPARIRRSGRDDEKSQTLIVIIG